MDHEEDRRKPSEQHGGTTPGAAEAGQKGEWAAKADEGGVPADDGGADAPREILEDDPELESPVLGATAGSDEPATESGVDRTAGDEADATSDGGNEPSPEGVEPDTKDIGAPPKDIGAPPKDIGAPPDS